VNGCKGTEGSHSVMPVSPRNLGSRGGELFGAHLKSLPLKTVFIVKKEPAQFAMR
jgi:hypothetical protein